MDIREATPGELPELRDIERAAGRCFLDLGMPEIAFDEPLSVEELGHHQREGLIWVAVDGGEIMAYLVAALVDGNAHVEQVSVHPDHARRRIGRSLIDHLAAVAVARGLPALTLTTFRDVAWNGPYYERCGFRVLDDSELGPGLRAVRRIEAERGLDRWPRASMRKDL
jgi:ribosomal protein S18 acetylase RimI-like enzyme